MDELFFCKLANEHRAMKIAEEEEKLRLLEIEEARLAAEDKTMSDEAECKWNRRLQIFHACIQGVFGLAAVIAMFGIMALFILLV